MSAELYDQIAPENRAEVEARCVRTLFARARQATMLAPLGTLFIFWVVKDVVSLPKRAQALVLEWAAQHRTELMEDWSLCQSKQLPKNIPPLE